MSTIFVAHEHHAGGFDDDFSKVIVASGDLTTLMDHVGVEFDECLGDMDDGGRIFTKSGNPRVWITRVSVI